MRALFSIGLPNGFPADAIAAIVLLNALSACTPTPGSDLPEAAGDTKISKMDVAVKTRSDGRLETITAITYNPEKISRDDLVATTPRLCADYGNLRVGSVTDGTSKEPDSRVLLVQCL